MSYFLVLPDGTFSHARLDKHFSIRRQVHSIAGGGDLEQIPCKTFAVFVTKDSMQENALALSLLVNELNVSSKNCVAGPMVLVGMDEGSDEERGLTKEEVAAFKTSCQPPWWDSDGDSDF